jgi:hypothetical protein
MKRYSVPALVSLAIFSAFWAYTIASTLIRELAKDVTFIDLGALFVLGLISGLALGLVVALHER